MQTFLPYPSFEMTAQCLDNRRLGNQRNEASVILNTLRGGKQGWVHHPVVKMWRGYENALAYYLNTCITEWIRRGFKNNMEYAVIDGEIKWPPWLGNEEFHASHRSNLLRKDSPFYGKYSWLEPSTLPYVWPVR